MTTNLNEMIERLDTVITRFEELGKNIDESLEASERRLAYWLSKED